MSNEKLFYIQDGWVGNSCLWWAIDSKGYTTDIRKAGKYTHKQTMGIFTRPKDVASKWDYIDNCFDVERFVKYVAWECDYVDNCLDAQRLVVIANYLDTDKCLL
jgi:hypothetical protein